MTAVSLNQTGVSIEKLDLLLELLVYPKIAGNRTSIVPAIKKKKKQFDGSVSKMGIILVLPV